ncbi:MAG: LiaF transmembrane domain-containing protein [Ginsengibacter sp.]
MEKNENQFGGEKRPRVWSGIVLLTAGGLLLAYKMGAPIPGWFFTWPVLLIAVGLLTGIKSRFHNPGALIMIVVGGIFLIDQTSPELKFHDYILPAILIAVGIVYILRPRRTWGERHSRHWRRSSYQGPAYVPPSDYHQPGTDEGFTEDASESVEINAVFGSVKKIILSKNFKGGEINCFMGGAELNLLKADLQKQVNLEVNNVFGGTKLIVPTNWDVKNEVTAVFGGIEDKRNVTGVTDPGKVLVLHGTCVFGGIEVVNY